ncbi:MAG: 2-keto-4-pentenoate hydratase [Gammaproteobacteria bacterium]|jgi:2-keto-4-pentenoate hydratase
MVDERTTRAAKAAQFLLDGKRVHRAFSAIPEEYAPRSVEEAYAVQAAFHAVNAQRHGEIVGYKVALTTKVMQQMVGYEEPIPGAIFASTVHTSPSTTACADYTHLGIECEIAVRLARDLPAASEPYTRAVVTDAIDDVMAAFELVDDRNVHYPDFASNILSFIGDNAWNAGVVLGQTVTNWRDLDLAAVRGVMQINDEDVAEGVGADVMGHPLDALAWLANQQVGRGRPLRAGMLVMTGSIIATRFVAVGDSVRFVVGGMPEVRIDIQ